MKEERYTCDKCGRVIKINDEDLYYGLGEYDLCDICKLKFIKWLEED